MTNESYLGWMHVMFFSILGNRIVNAMTSQCKMAENLQNCSYQLAYSSALADLNINRTYIIVLLNGTLSSVTYECIYVYCALVLKAS